MNVELYRISYHRKAKKELKRIEPHKQRDRIERRIDALSENPMPLDAKKLSPPLNGFGLRQGRYRIIYELQESQIDILKIGHRKEIYRS